MIGGNLFLVSCCILPTDSPTSAGRLDLGTAEVDVALLVTLLQSLNLFTVCREPFLISSVTFSTLSTCAVVEVMTRLLNIVLVVESHRGRGT